MIKINDQRIFEDDLYKSRAQRTINQHSTYYYVNDKMVKL